MQDVIEAGLFINGAASDAADGGRYEIFNPARPDELVGTAAEATDADVQAVVDTAHAAVPAWARLSVAERADYLLKIADMLQQDEADMEARARLFTRENGKILFESRLEVGRIWRRFQQVASYAERLAEEEVIAGPPFDTIIARQSMGVCLLIIPWNWPLSLIASKLPQALLAGNTVVVKPSESATLMPTITLHKIAKLLPPGVLNVITGDARRFGDDLVGHPKVRMVNFTGSVPVGRHVMQVAARNITPVTLELGGNDAGLVLQDAELDEDAFVRLRQASFMTTGQVCMALKRLYVHRSRYDEVIDGLRKMLDEAVVGDGLIEETTMGPLNSKRQLGIVSGFVDEARVAGAEIEAHGTVPDEALFNGGGYFMRPMLVLNPDPSLKVVAEEQFGPVLPIIPFDSEDGAIALANDTPYGLCSSVWTSDKDRATNIARQLEAGMTYINGHGPMMMDGRSPFGGFKQSGIGRNYGFEGVVQFQEYHSIIGNAGTFVATS